MRSRTKVLTMSLAVMLTLGLLDLHQTSFAQSARNIVGFQQHTPESAPAASPNSNCKTIRGNGVQVFDPATGLVTGPVTNSGILDGALEDAINFAAGFVFTPDPTVVAYTTNLTITTIQGQLKASPVTTQSIVTGVGAEWGSINPSASTGRFAGATGTILVAFKPIGDPSVGPYQTEITADICFAQ